MHIWVDADACPSIIKDILFRAAIRTRTYLTLVSNHSLSALPSPYISKLQVGAGLDVVDDKIIQSVNSNDLVITADIPLAKAVIDKGCIVLNPRGEFYTQNNINECLSIRNFHTDLRNSGLISGGPATLSKKNLQIFSNKLDSLLTKK